MNNLTRTYELLTRALKREANYYRNRPTNALFFMTYRCTSHCKTCVMWQRKVDKSQELSLEQWKKVVDQLKGLRIQNIELFGGDALLRKDILFELTDYIYKSGIPSVDLTTNSNLLDDETARKIVASGILDIYLSLDGVGKHHDDVRGTEGTFARVDKAIKSILKERQSRKTPRILVNCTVSAANIDHFEEVFDYAVSVGADCVAFEYVGEFPRESVHCSRIGEITASPYYAAGEKSVLLNNEQARVLKQKIKQIKDKAHKTKIDLITKNIDVLSLKKITSGKIINKRCYVSRYLIMVDPYGNVLPCLFFSNYLLGNLLTHDLGSLWNGSQQRKFFKARDKGKLPICEHCIVGVERNPTFIQFLKNSYYSYSGKGIDEK